MKRNWLLCLVIFSLALNLGTIGTFVYLRYQDQKAGAPGQPPPPMHMRELWGALKLDDQQRQALHRLFPEHHRKVMALRQELGQKRRELFDLLKDEATPWSAMQTKIQEISNLQGSLEEEVVRHFLEFKKILKPEQYAAFWNLMQERLGRTLDGMGGRFGPRGPGMGRGGRGMGPMGPPGPPMGPLGPGAPGFPPPAPPPPE